MVCPVVNYGKCLCDLPQVERNAVERSNDWPIIRNFDIGALGTEERERARVHVTLTKWAYLASMVGQCAKMSESPLAPRHSVHQLEACIVQPNPFPDISH